MKQVHLYTKRRPLPLIELQDITCPKHPEDVVHKCKSSLKKKRQLKEALIYDGEDVGDNATSSKRTRLGSKKITRKGIKLLTGHNYDKENNPKILLVTNIEYTTGHGGMFTQSPPPTIAGGVESLNDKIENKLDENESDDHDDVNHKFSIEDSDEDPINEETDLVKEYDEIEEEVETKKDDKDAKDIHDDDNHKFSIEDIDKNPINEEINFVKEYDEVEEDVVTNKDDMNDKDKKKDDMDDNKPKKDV